MKRDDPIAQLRLLDPADEKDVDVVVAALAATGTPDRVEAHTPPPAPRRRRPRVALVAVAVAAAVVIGGALVANPFTRSGAISSAEAKAQVARALELAGDWHVTQTFQGTITDGSGTPRFEPPATMDTWHAADGRLLVTSSGAGETVVSLYAGREARIYNPRTRKLTIRPFRIAADMRDQERWFLPASATGLYDAAYRVGKVRLAGIEELHGRRVYQLVFDWLGTSYTLVFDADRRVPISSESRTPNAGNKVMITRTRYTAYERVEPGPRLENELRLPPIPAGAKTVRETPLVIPQPIQGASATRAMRAVPGFAAYAALDRARWLIVRRFPGGSVFAAALVPSKRADRDTCYAFVEIAHPGGAARPLNFGCPTGVGMQQSQDGKRMLLTGFTKASGIEIRFANGARVRPVLRNRVFLAAPPIKLFQYAATILRTYPNGKVLREPFMQWPSVGGLPAWLTR